MNKNKRTFIELYDPVHEQLARYCRAVAGNREDAQDLVNETVLKAMESFKTLKNQESFKPFLFAIARNINKMRLRRNKFWKGFDKEEIIEMMDDGNVPELVTEFNMIYEKILSLPQKTSEAMILFHISDLSLEEIQKIQGGSLSGVKLRLKRGREKLLEMLNTPKRVKAVMLFLSI